MQKQISHPEGLPACAFGHAARHMTDLRAGRCGGGHFIECACRHTPRFPDFDQALVHWRTVNGLAPVAHRPRVIPMRAAGRAKGWPA